MKANITRRDFLNGAALVVGAAIVPDALGSMLDGPALAQNAPGYYPPALTGLRGSTDASFQAAHQLRDDAFWQHAPKPTDTGEEFDSIVVGGGISGLSSSIFLSSLRGTLSSHPLSTTTTTLAVTPSRNEFLGTVGCSGYGGTYSIESPDPYSPRREIA